MNKKCMPKLGWDNMLESGYSEEEKVHGRINLSWT
jgi:hypothetical protein